MNITKANVEKIYKALCFYLKVENIYIGSANEICVSFKAKDGVKTIIDTIRYQDHQSHYVFMSLPKYIHKIISSAAICMAYSCISIESFAYWFRANEFFVTKSIIKKIMQVLIEHALCIGDNTIPKISCLEELVLNYDMFHPAESS